MVHQQLRKFLRGALAAVLSMTPAGGAATEGALDQAGQTRTAVTGAHGGPESSHDSAARGYTPTGRRSAVRLGHNGGRAAPPAQTQTPPHNPRFAAEPPPVGAAMNAEANTAAANAEKPPMSRQAAAGTAIGLLAGAALGFAVGGPAGAIIGAVIGAFIGAWVRSENHPIFNFGGK